MSGDTAVADVIVGLLTDLIAIPSTVPPGDTRRICAYAADRLEAAGYRTALVSRPGRATEEGLVNLVASLGEAHPVLAFNAHVDTVDAGDLAAWRSDPFRAIVHDGEVRGLGAVNAKSSVAVQLWLAEEIARRGGPAAGQVMFTLAADEENIGPDGTFYLREAGHLRPDMLVVGAQLRNRLIVAERGILWARVTTTGKAAHAGAPAEGDSAIARMVRLIGRLDRELAPPIAERRAGPMQSTLNIGLIRGGTNTNVVPGHCAIEIDRRLLPTETVDGAFAEIRDLMLAAGEPAGTVAVERLRGTNGYAAAEDSRLVRAFGAIGVAPTRDWAPVGASDARYFADDGIELATFGPGDGALGHAANEAVPITELVEAARVQLALVEKLLGLKR